MSLAEVLPPPKLVTRLSAPRRFERYSNSSLGLNCFAWVSSQRLGSSRESAGEGLTAGSFMQQSPYGRAGPPVLRRQRPGVCCGAHYRSNLDQIWSVDNLRDRDLRAEQA